MCLAVGFIAAWSVGCGTQKRQDDLLIIPTDQGQDQQDMGVVEDQPADDQGSADAGADLGQDQGPSCQGDCAKTALNAKFNGTEAPLTKAFYGLSAATTTDSGAPELYLELFEADFEGCPVQDSPTPKRTIILTGIKLPVEQGTLTQDDGVKGKLLDYDGVLLGDGLFADPTSATVDLMSAQLCLECLGMPAPSHEEGFVSFDLNLQFEGGTIAGHVYATHCDSMDAAGP